LHPLIHHQDPPLRVTVVRSVALIIVIGRLIIVVFKGVKCGPDPHAWSAVYPFAGRSGLKPGPAQ